MAFRFSRGKRGDGRRSGFSERKRRKKWRGQRSEQHVVEHVANCNTQETSDIPGFYYDSERKRYFRIPLSSDPELTMATDQFLKINKMELNSASAVRNCSSLIRLKDELCYGNTNSDAALRRSVNEQKLDTVKLVQQFRVPFITNEDHCIHFISGSENTVIGFWDVAQLIMILDPYERDCLVHNDRVSPHAMVTDIVSLKHRRGRRHYVYSSYLSNSFSGIITIDSDRGDFAWKRQTSKVIFSIAYNSNNGVVAYGGENEIGLRTNYGEPIVRSNTGGENIHCLSYDDDGTCLVAGSHRGTVLCYDTRNMNDPAFKMRTKRRLLYQIRKLGTSGDPYVICSGYDNYLASIDTRMRREVLRYDGFVNDDQKLRFDVDSGREVLCSSGRDGSTRIWNVKNGELIRCIEPPTSYDRRSGNLHSVLLQPRCNVYDPDVVVLYGNNGFVYRCF